jgi:ketosteroid isomerase-like protein
MKKQTIVILLLLCTTIEIRTQEKNLPPDLATLVATERAFAKLSVDRGVRVAFLTFFADDGINFQPHPVKTREAFLSRPAPETRPPVVLNWAPIYGDVAQAGDLGYNTGPFTLEDHSAEKRTTQHGQFFSVWRRQADRSWKVVLDIGVRLPQAVAPLDAPNVPARSRSTKVQGEVKPDEARVKLLEIERQFLTDASQRGISSAYATAMHDEVRMLRPSMMPLVGQKAVLGWVAGEQRRLTGEPIDGGISRSGDLGYVYGRYELQPTSGTAEKGYYARVWKMIGGKWKIVMDVTNALT